jgi:hypothetical protein
MGRGERLREEIAVRGFAHATVTGTSMLPTLRPDEIVRLERATDVRPGHIVAFECGGGLLVHRVVRVAPGHVVCRGDNRLQGDGITPQAAIVGRAVEVFGPRRQRGARLRDDRRALRNADLRLGVRRVGVQARHVGAEVALVARQALGRRPTGQGIPVDLAGFDAVSPEAPESAQPPVIRAGAYSSLPADARTALVRDVLRDCGPGAEITVIALAVSPEHRLARVGAALRLGLRRVGVEAGEPGDATWPTADGRAHVAVHLFSAAQLTAELERAGARALEVRPVMECRTRVWSATIVS